MSRIYDLPEFLLGVISRESYIRWLQRKATAHVKRDRKRGNHKATISAYKMAIHEAVIECKGHDQFTGEKLDWYLISTYSNAKSTIGGRYYKADFAMLPTVDHLDDGLGEPRFAICSWRTNSCKNDLSLSELIQFSRTLLAYQDRMRKD